jgi:regulator of cell morphogenesis and NO signaling
MAEITLSTTVGQVVAQAPHLARVFEDWNIDYCCGGKKPLGQVCESRGLDAGRLLQQLAAAGSAQPVSGADNWIKAPLAELCEHIARTHHDYLRRELPRLSGLIAKVVSAHGAKDPSLAKVQTTFAELRAELEPHMMKEECVLFPSIRFLEANRQPAQFPFGSLTNPIRVMVNDHDHAGDSLERLRALTHGYRPPAGACNTYRVMLEGLAALERDMHQHVHKENNILFPRAVELEAQIGAPAPAAEACGCHCSSQA